MERIGASYIIAVPRMTSSPSLLGGISENLAILVHPGIHQKLIESLVCPRSLHVYNHIQLAQKACDSHG